MIYCAWIFIFIFLMKKCSRCGNRRVEWQFVYGKSVVRIKIEN